MILPNNRKLCHIERGVSQFRDGMFGCVVVRVKTSANEYPSRAKSVQSALNFLFCGRKRKADRQSQDLKLECTLAFLFIVAPRNFSAALP